MCRYIIFCIFLLIPIFESCVNCVSEKKSDSRIHFFADKWTGQPGGLLYYDGVYHLFYQCNPDKPTFGNISIGHAHSTDLVNWKIEGIAVQSEKGTSINTGNVVVDIHNTSGFGSSEQPAFLAFYTVDNSRVSDEFTTLNSIYLAYSLDAGKTWEKYPIQILQNPEVPLFQNPNVAWNEVLGKWLMTISTGTTIQIYTSDNCIKWEFRSEFGENVNSIGGWESSSLFSIADDKNQATKWILLVSMNGGPANGSPAVRYFVGDLVDGEFHQTQYDELWLDYGRDNYGSMVFDNLESKVALSWMNCWDYANLLPTTNQRGAMTIPRELRLVKDVNHYLLKSSPVFLNKEQFQKEKCRQEFSVKDSMLLYSNLNISNQSYLIETAFNTENRFAIWAPQKYGVYIKTKSGKRLEIGYNADMKYYYIDRSKLFGKSFSPFFDQVVGAAYPIRESQTDWTILIDQNSIEFFACEGRIAITSLFYSNEELESVELFAQGGSMQISYFTLNSFRK